MSAIGQGRVVGFLKARVDAFTGTVKDATDRISSEGFIGDIFQILESGFGTLAINDFGRSAQRRREAARKVLTGY